MTRELKGIIPPLTTPFTELRSFGVDTSRVIWADKGRVGTFSVEWGASPRPLTTIYDRGNSAATTMVADELDWGYVAGAQWLQLTGITPAISETCKRSTREIAARAHRLGLKVFFDVNYRSLLWTPTQARAACERILPYVGLLTGTERDMAMLLGETLEPEHALERLFASHNFDAVVMTLGAKGSVAYDGQSLYFSPGYDVETVNRLGAGDAFDAGLLYGYLRHGLQAGLEYGSAMAALKMTIPQNIPIVNREHVERLIAGRNVDLDR